VLHVIGMVDLKGSTFST